MEPFHFESSGDELFGMYHPASDPNARRGVVLCPPFVSEANRIYQGTRVLAQRWSDKAHVLRFDYSGTGDSFGDWERAGPARWIADIAQAASELTEISGASKIVLAGVRFGALLAANSAVQSGASELILWDPVLSGKQYRDDLNSMHQKLIGSHVALSRNERSQANSELCGFGLASWMDTEIPALAMPAALPETVETVRVVQTIDQDINGRVFDAWADNGRGLEFHSVDFHCAWDSDPEAVLNPSPVIEELARCL
ncbi:MAG: hypothetical protein ACR2PA_09415 [Hyphomicrobiaceae bacterium]